MRSPGEHEHAPRVDGEPDELLEAVEVHQLSTDLDAFLALAEAEVAPRTILLFVF